MTLREKHFKSLLDFHLPPWSSRVGYTGGDDGIEKILSAGLLGIPLEEAPRFSLHGFYVDFDNAPTRLKDLISLLESLLPGGIGILKLPGRNFRRKEFVRICKSVGLKVKQCSPIYFFLFPLARLYRFFTGSHFQPTFPIFRVIQHFEHQLFRFLRLPFGDGLFAVVEKPMQSDLQRNGKKLSILLTNSGENDRFLEQNLKAWYEFIEKEKITDKVEIILINDGPLAVDPDQFTGVNDENDTFQLIRHYRRFGGAVCLRTGIIHSRGRRILIDESAGLIAPDQFFPLLHPYLSREVVQHSFWSSRKPRKIKRKDQIGVVLGFDSNLLSKTIYNERLNSGIIKFSRRFYFRLKLKIIRQITGSVVPFSTFRLYTFRSGRSILSGREIRSLAFRLGSIIRLKTERWGIATIPVERINSRNSRNSRDTRGDIASNSLVKIILFRLRPFFSYLLITLTLISTSLIALSFSSPLINFFTREIFDFVSYYASLLSGFPVLQRFISESKFTEIMFYNITFFFVLSVSFLEYIMLMYLIIRDTTPSFRSFLISLVRNICIFIILYFVVISMSSVTNYAVLLHPEFQLSAQFYEKLPVLFDDQKRAALFLFVALILIYMSWKLHARRIRLVK